MESGPADDGRQPSHHAVENGAAVASNRDSSRSRSSRSSRSMDEEAPAVEANPGAPRPTDPDSTAAMPEETDDSDADDADDDVDNGKEDMYTGENDIESASEPASPSVSAHSLVQSVTDIDGSDVGAAPEVDRPVEHDSLVTVRLSEPADPPNLTIDTGRSSRAHLDSQANLSRPTTPTTPTANQVQRDTMSVGTESEAEHGEDVDDSSDDSDDADEAVNWDQLQQTEEKESSGQTVDNTALLLARLEQENAKLATNPKSVRVRVQSPKRASQQTPRRVRPPSVAQLRDMVRGPTPAPLRYSLLPPPPMTDLEFYAALVQDYHQTAARLPTLLSNKIRKGIPPPLRGVVWQGMTGATRDTALGDQYDQFSGATSPYEGIIGKDLGRSFPGVEMFRDPDGDGQRMLGRVLKSYSLHEPRIGYCQGLAFLVGPLLMHMPDKEAFCVLVKLMENYDLRSSYMPDLAGLHVRIYQFRELLRTTLPEVSSHLHDLQVDPAAYVSQWFLSFFAVTCPLPMLFRMYDVVFAEGAAETIMRVALSLMQKNQARLLACAELEDAIQLLLSRGLWDCYHYNADEFVQHFLSLSTVVTRDRLALLDQAYREAQIANVNQTGGDNYVDRSSALSTIASRFLGRLWPTSSISLSSPSSTSSPTAAASATTTSAPTSAASASAGSSASNSNTSNPLSPTSASPPPASQPLAGLSSGPSAGLSAPPRRPLSMLQRSSSKQSIASTVNSMDATASATGQSSSASSSSSSVLSSTSTEATSLSRDSSDLHVAPKAAAASGGVNTSGSGSKASDSDRYLHSQIEDLLTAFTDLQRQHALVTDQLQREREERNDDRKAAQGLLQRLSASDLANEEGIVLSKGELQALLEPMAARFASDVDHRRSSIPQTKAQLRDELVRAKEQLANELAKGQDHNRRVYEMEQEVATMKEQLRDSHQHVRSLHQDKQRLERLIHDMRTRAASETAAAASSQGVSAAGAGFAYSNGADPRVSHAGSLTGSGSATATTGGGALGIADAASEWFGRATGVTVGAGSRGGVGAGGGSGGLRELKLGRSKSTPQVSSSASSAGPPPPSSGTLSMSAFGGGGTRSSSLAGRGGARRDSNASSMVSGYAAGQDNNTDQQQEALVLELVQAKTAEAVARQEAEEAKQKLESLRKALKLSPADLASMIQNASSSAGSSAGAASTAASAAIGMFGRLTASASTPDTSAHGTGGKLAAAPAAAAAPATTPTTGYGGFFGWRR